jgi:hypothetical protein
MTDDGIAITSRRQPGSGEDSPIAVTTHRTMIPGLQGTSLIFVFFPCPCWRRGLALPRSRRSVSLHEKEKKIGADRQGTRVPRQPLAPGSRAAPQFWIHCLQPPWKSGIRIGQTARPCGRHGLLASWRRGSLWIHSAEHAHRASCERGGSLVRQAPGPRVGAPFL